MHVAIFGLLVGNDQASSPFRPLSLRVFGHFWRDPAAAYDQVMKLLPSNAETLRSLDNRNFQLVECVANQLAERRISTLTTLASRKIIVRLGATQKAQSRARGFDGVDSSAHSQMRIDEGRELTASSFHRVKTRQDCLFLLKNRSIKTLEPDRAHQIELQV